MKKGKAAIPRWFGQIERMEGERLVKKTYRADVKSNRETKGEIDQKEDRWTKSKTNRSQNASKKGKSEMESRTRR